MPPAVQDSHDADEVRKDAIDYEVRKSVEQAQTCAPVGHGKNFWLLTEQLEAGLHRLHEFRPEPGTPPLVPERRFCNISLCFAADDGRASSKAREDAFTCNVPRRSALRLSLQCVQSPIEFCDLFGGEIDRRRFLGDAVPELFDQLNALGDKQLPELLKRRFHRQELAPSCSPIKSGERRATQRLAEQAQLPPTATSALR